MNHQRENIRTKNDSEDTKTSENFAFTNLLRRILPNDDEGIEFKIGYSLDSKQREAFNLVYISCKMLWA